MINNVFKKKLTYVRALHSIHFFLYYSSIVCHNILYYIYKYIIIMLALFMYISDSISVFGFKLHFSTLNF